MTYQPDMVIYHGKCVDGFTAAWAAWRKWGNEPEYIACHYGEPPPEALTGKHVLIVDFSFSRDTIVRLLNEAEAASIVILDHHKTAQSDLEPFQFVESRPGEVGPDDIPLLLHVRRVHGRPPVIALFDMERSGAGMAWDFINADLGPLRARPRLVDLVEDRDLWRFRHGDDSRFLHLALTSGETSFQRWEDACEFVDAFVARGQAISAYRDMLVAEIAAPAEVFVIDDEEGISVDCPYSLVSDVCHYLLQKWPAARFAAGIVRSEQFTTYSLRSTDDRADVSALAKRFGGGGHRNAAGFKVPQRIRRRPFA